MSKARREAEREQARWEERRRIAEAERATERQCTCDPRFTPDDPDEPCICGGTRD